MTSVTQLWTAFLATLAAFSLGVLWIFSQASGEVLVDSQGVALRAVANASLAALESEIDRSIVQNARSFSRSAELQSIARKATRSGSPGRFTTPFRDLAYQGPLQEHPELSVALLDPWGEVLAEAGLAGDELRTLAKRSHRDNTPSDLERPEPALTMLSGRAFVFSIRRIGKSPLRLLSLAPLHAHGEGPIRRALGSSYPAALIASSKVALELSGSETVSTLLPQMPKELGIPSAGISEYTLVGKGADRRLAVWGRLDSKYQYGDTALALLVFSPDNAGYKSDGFGARLSSAWNEVPNPGRGTILLLALWLTAVGLSLMLPRVEWLLPVQRLTRAIQEGDTRTFNERLATGNWSRHFEPLVAALGRRILRNSTHRNWQLSGSRSGLRSSVQTPVVDPSGPQKTRDALPTEPSDVPDLGPDKVA